MRPTVIVKAGDGSILTSYTCLQFLPGTAGRIGVSSSSATQLTTRGRGSVASAVDGDFRVDYRRTGKIRYAWEVGHYDETQSAGWIASFVGAFVLLLIYRLIKGRSLKA